ncbi:MAG: HlyD family secretion protein [bacterium]|nr:MAG: HlyD family secretion protein [bacterium]
MSENGLANTTNTSHSTDATSKSTASDKVFVLKWIKPSKHFYLVVLVVILLLVTFSCWEVTVTSDCILLPEKDRFLIASAQENGILREIRVKDGDWVAADTILGVCQDLDMEKQLVKLSAEIKQAQSRLVGLQSEYAEQKANVEQAKSYNQHRQREAQELVVEEDAIKKYKSNGEVLTEYPPELLELSAQIQTKQSEEQIQILESQVDESTSRYQITILNRRAAEDRLRAAEMVHRRKVKTAITEKEVTQKILQAALYKLKAFDAEMASINSEIASSSDELALLQKKKDSLTIKALQKGLVLAQDLEKKLGKYLERGSEFCRIADISELRAVVAVSERDITQVRLGSTVRIRIRSSVDQVFTGTVSYIGTEAIITPENSLRIYNCEVKVDNTKQLLRPGMSGVTRISLAYQRGYSIAFRWLKHVIKLEYWPSW